MAEGDITVYNNFKEQVLLGAVDLSSDTLRVTLHTGYTPDVDHNVWGDASGTEYPTYGNYTANGVQLLSGSVTQDDANDRAAFDANNVTWTSLNLSGTTPSDAVIRDTTATECLVCWVELGTTATNGGDYTLQWHTDGIFLLS